MTKTIKLPKFEMVSCPIFDIKNGWKKIETELSEKHNFEHWEDGPYGNSVICTCGQTGYKKYPEGSFHTTDPTNKINHNAAQA